MLIRLTEIAFLLLIFSLGFMQPFQYLSGMTIPFTDLIFLVAFGLWTLSLLFRQTKFHWHKFYWLLVFYFLAILLSELFSNDQKSSFIKLLGEMYLLSLPVLTFNSIQTDDFAKRVLQTWLAGTSLVILVGIATVILFYFDRENWLLTHTLSHFGTLPPGNYPRLRSTFVNANMLCNYLSVSLMMLLIAQKIGWVNKKAFYPMFGGILCCSLFTISPGLGGIGLLLGLWYFIYFKQTHKLLAFTSLVTGSFLAIIFIIAGLIAPNIYPTAPFYIDVPIIERRLEPSVRILTWTGAFKTFTQHPVFGVGLDQPVCNVEYLDFSGNTLRLDDAHNLFFNVAAHEGILGFLAISAIIIYLSQRLFPLISNNDKRDILRIGLALAFVSAFVYQGLSGSFEDTRHLWVLIGLCLSAEKFNQ